MVLKKSMKKVIGLALTLAVVLSLQVSAFAVDLAYKNGSIEVCAVLGSDTLSGVELSIYKVASAVEDGADGIKYELTDAFKDTNVELNGLTAQQTMEAAAALRSAAVTADATGTTDSEGKYLFTGLDMGAFLIVMTNNGGNNILMNPFIIYLPYNLSGEWYTAVKATPKTSVPVPWYPDPSDPIEEIPDPSDPLDPGDPGDPGDPEPPVIEIPDPEDPLASLPQTGLLQWPIPVMAFMGIVLFCIGWIVNSKKKAANEE